VGSGRVLCLGMNKNCDTIMLFRKKTLIEHFF